MTKRLAVLILFGCASLGRAAFIPGPIQVNNAAGTATPVGYATSGSSVPIAPAPGAVFSTNGTLSDNGAAATTNRIGSTPGVYQTNYAGGTAGTVGRDSAQDHGTDGLHWVAALPSLRPASFSASSTTFLVAATASDVSALCGNASNMILVYGLRVSCTQTTAGIVNLAVIKRSTKFVGAWSTMTVVSDDSNYAVTNSTAVVFTANPTVGTFAGYVDSQKLGCMAPGTAAANDIYISPASWRVKPKVLRGAAECLAVNLQAQTLTGGACSVGWDWIETTTITE